MTLALYQAVHPLLYGKMRRASVLFNVFCVILVLIARVDAETKTLGPATETSNLSLDSIRKAINSLTVRSVPAMFPSTAVLPE
jgi:hypothetical protein